MASYIMEFSVHGPVSFLSHLELMKVFRQSFRRAGLPVSFSEGFNPHMKLSFAIAKSVGLESDGELLEVETREEIDAVAFRSRINEALPSGLEIVLIRDKGSVTKSLSALLRRSSYLLLCSGGADCAGAILEKLEAPSIVMEVKSKKSVGMKDLKEYIVGARPVEGGVEVTVLAGSEKNLRIDYLVRYLDLDLRVIRHRLLAEDRPLAELFV